MLKLAKSKPEDHVSTSLVITLGVCIFLGALLLGFLSARSSNTKDEQDTSPNEAETLYNIPETKQNIKTEHE